jgi:hypothetical protein
MKLKLPILALRATLLLSAAGTGLADTTNSITIANYSFENPTVADGGYTTSPPGWNTSGTAAAFAIINPGTGNWPSAAPAGMDGSNAGQIFMTAAGQSGVFYQDVGVEYAAGVTYQLTAAIGLETNQVFDTNSVLVFYNSSLVAIASNIITPAKLIAGAFTNITLSYTATGTEGGNGDIVVGFSAPAAAVAGSYFDFDNVRLVAIYPPAPLIYVPVGGDIQAAINGAAALGGGTVNLAAGVYPIASTIIMQSGCTLNGLGSTTILQGPNAAYSWPIIQSTSDYNHDITIQNLVIDGNIPASAVDPNGGSASPYWNALGIFINSSVIGVTNVTIKNVEVRHCSMGSNPKGISGLTIDSCYFHENGYYPLLHNLYIRRLTHVLITNTISINSYIGTGLHVADTNNAWITVGGCSFGGNADNGVNVQDTPSNITMENCDISYNHNTASSTSDSAGMDFTGTSALIDHCQFNYNGKEGLHSWGGSGTISANNAYGNGGPSQFDIHGSFTQIGNTGNPLGPPAAPTGLAATAVSSNQINLLWTISIGATSYNVERAMVSGGPYTTIAPGVTSMSWSDTNIAFSATYYYVVTALNAINESPDSSEASATVAGAASPGPAVTVSPDATNVECGNSLTLTANASGAPPLSYQWYDNQANAIPGATNATLVLTNLPPAQAGAYAVVVTNLYGAATNAGTVNVVDTLMIVTQPLSQTNNAGSNVTFTVSATACTTLSYQWYFNTNTALTNQTNSTLTLLSVGLGDAGSYSVLITSAGGQTNSQAAVLTVVGQPQPPMLLTGQVLSDQTFQLLLNGPSNETYRVLASTNVSMAMSNWVALVTNTFPGVQTNYTDTAATNYGSRVYRVQAPAP